MDGIVTFIDKYLTIFSIPKMTLIDVLEILIIAFCLYHIIIWVKSTRAWQLAKGVIVLVGFFLVAIVLDMTAIQWILENSINVLITAAVIVFHPEIRKALEQLGRRNFLASLISFEDSKDKSERFSDKTIQEIVRAVFEMAKVKTGALIVIEKDVSLTEYERTGITYKVAVLPLQKNLAEKADPLFRDLCKLFPCTYDLSGSIGKRYRRQDEIGTPYCITVDFDTLEDESVTVRDRDTMKQERVKIADLKAYFDSKFVY